MTGRHVSAKSIVQWVIKLPAHRRLMLLVASMGVLVMGSGVGASQALAAMNTQMIAKTQDTHWIMTPGDIQWDLFSKTQDTRWDTHWIAAPQDTHWIALPGDTHWDTHWIALPGDTHWIAAPQDTHWSH